MPDLSEVAHVPGEDRVKTFLQVFIAVVMVVWFLSLVVLFTFLAVFLIGATA